MKKVGGDLVVIQPLAKINQKFGNFFIVGVLIVFFVFSSLLLFSNVQQRTIDYKEGQVSEQSIRANKTIENITATEQKRNPPMSGFF